MDESVLSQIVWCFQPTPSTVELLSAPDRRLPPCCSTAAPGTSSSSWRSRGTSVASRTATGTRESPVPVPPAHNTDMFHLTAAAFVSHSPLHLAIIHQQTGVIQQLIHTLLSSQQQKIFNTANHLQQVRDWTLAPASHASIVVHCCQQRRCSRVSVTTPQRQRHRPQMKEDVLWARVIETDSNKNSKHQLMLSNTACYWLLLWLRL